MRRAGAFRLLSSHDVVIFSKYVGGEAIWIAVNLKLIMRCVEKLTSVKPAKPASKPVLGESHTARYCRCAVDPGGLKGKGGGVSSSDTNVNANQAFDALPIIRRPRGRLLFRGGILQ